MPIIPANWTGIETVNAENMGGSGFPIYQFSKSFSITISELNTFIDLIGFCDTPINREISLDILSGSLQLYWKNYDNTYTQISRDNLNFNNGYGYVDTTLGQLGLSVKVSEPTELFLVIRWDKDFDFQIFTGDLMINPKVRLLFPTGTNYPINANAYDTELDTTIYTSNLDKLKNSDSGVTGFKLFDIFSFYPGKAITFNVVISNQSSSLYGNIAIQLLDPIDVGQAVFDVANDIINLENRNVADDFIGNLTRNALYKDVTSNQAILYPDFSRHIGRFVAQNTTNNDYYDTAIIESYTPNSDPLLGGTFTLTGDF